MKKLLFILSLLVFVNNVYAQDEHGCPLFEGEIDPIPGLPLICYEKAKKNAGPGFPGNPNSIRIDEVPITKNNPRHPSNPWFPYIISPVYYPTQSSGPKEPCDLLKSLGGKAAFNNIRNNLAKKAATDNYESAGIFYGDNIIDVKGKKGEHSIPITLYDKINGLMHNHVKGGYSIFSYSDLISISQLYTQGLMMSPEGFFFGVTTHQKTNYVLTIENLSLFSTYADKIVEGISPGLPYEFFYEGLVNKKNSVQQNLHGFLNYLRIEKTGMKLFEYDENKKDWVPKELDEKEGKRTIISNPCK